MSRTTAPLECFLDGVGLIGPGLRGWADSIEALAGRAVPAAERTVVPAPSSLPPAERRRASVAVKIALAAGQQALEHAGASAELATVFASSGGDGVNCHEICQALASSDRLISPTRFHNSVHNAPSGYWSIAMHAMAPSQSLCAFDASFGAGLLEAMCQVAADRAPVLLIAYDTEYPQPLRAIRPIPDAFGVALVLAPQRGERSLARLALRSDCLTREPAQTLADDALEATRRAIPAARSLPLLRALALGQPGHVVLDYLDDAQLVVELGA